RLLDAGYGGSGRPAPDDVTRPTFTRIGRWTGGAMVALALFTFGLLRPDNGSIPFFVLLVTASLGYLATLYQVMNGMRPSRRALIAGAGLPRPGRTPSLFPPPAPPADRRRSVGAPPPPRPALTPYGVVPADPAFAHLRTAENWPLNNPDVPSPYSPGAELFFL